jgi:hypothetical protein
VLAGYRDAVPHRGLADVLALPRGAGNAEEGSCEEDAEQGAGR